MGAEIVSNITTTTEKVGIGVSSWVFTHDAHYTQSFPAG